MIIFSTFLEVLPWLPRAQDVARAVGQGCLPAMQRAAHGRDGGALHRPCFSPPDGTPVGAVHVLKWLHHFGDSLNEHVYFHVRMDILPMFAFANTGVSLQGVTPASLLHSVPHGIALGLLIGKAVGVFARPSCGFALPARCCPTRPAGVSFLGFVCCAVWASRCAFLKVR